MFNFQYRYIIYAAIGLLTLSFLGFFHNWVNMAGFAVFGLLGLILGLWKREFALYLAFLELILGSFGYLLSFYGLSLRMVFFLIIMGLWLYDVIFHGVIPHLMRDPEKKTAWIPASAGMTRGLAAFLLIWIFGIVQGYLRGHNPADILFDANGYFYLLLILPATKYINSKEKLMELVKVLLVGTGVLSLWTIALFAIFSRYNNPEFLGILYKWLRDLRLAEITPLQNGAYRIFIQSQIFLLPAYFYVIQNVVRPHNILQNARDANFMNLQNTSRPRSILQIIFFSFLLLIIFSAGIYISLSRSFWVGTAVGLAVFFGILIYKKTRFKEIIFLAGKIAANAALGILLVYLIAPNGDTLKNRSAVGRPASNTRISQLKVLFPAIKNSPIFGYGFGKNLTYKSFDPRLGDPEKGVFYTTYAFELGYLDMLLKFGIVGLSAYLFFIWMVIRRLFKEKNIWIFAAMCALLAVHIFTPYLNHPLGIGILIMAGIISNIRE